MSKLAALEAMKNQSPSSPWDHLVGLEVLNERFCCGIHPAHVELRIRRARSSKAGLPPRTPRRMGCRPRCFNPSLPTRHATGSSLHQPGRTPHPGRVARPGSTLVIG